MVVGALGVGVVLITLYALDAQGILTVNEKAISIAAWGGVGYVGYKFAQLLTTFS